MPRHKRSKCRLLPFILAANKQNLDDIEELLLLGMLEDEADVDLNPRPVRPRFMLQSISRDEVISSFRFTKDDLYKLTDVLRMPDFIVCSNRTKAPAIEALCIVLRRFSYPNRLGDLSTFFKRSKAELSFICKATVNFICERHGYLLQNLNRQWLLKHDLERYSETISAKGSPHKNCWAFIEGSVRPICRPTRNHKLYSDYNKVHSLKYQSVISPDGLIVNLYGPVEGQKHDSHILHESNILEELENVCQGEYCVYGDPGYPVRSSLIVPFYEANICLEEQEFFMKISPIRESPDWGFRKILQNFAFLDCKKNLKIFLQPIGKFYVVGALVINLHTCLYGSAASKYFEIDPPSIEHYLEYDALSLIHI